MSSRLLRSLPPSRLEALPWNQARTIDTATLAVQPVILPVPRQAEADHLQKRVVEIEAAVEHRIAEARTAGYHEGETAGRRSAQQAAEPVLHKLADTIRQVAELRPRLRQEAEAEMIRLAVMIARRILNRELQCDPEAITGLVRIAFEKLRLQEVMRVTVHPLHQKALQTAVERGGAAHIEIIPDASLECGAAIFETARGKLDVSADTQLREIERGLADRLRAAGS